MKVYLVHVYNKGLYSHRVVAVFSARAKARKYINTLQGVDAHYDIDNVYDVEEHLVDLNDCDKYL